MIAAWYAPEWLKQPMLQVITWLLEVTGSYGLAIIGLTVIVRIVILPLTIYQTKSMKKLQEVQPRMKELQEKYKDNPEKLNQEMMALYKTEGANPFAGCLPMLIQMPILYALFAVFSAFDPTKVGAGYSTQFLWADLAQKDTLLAIITIVAMFAQSYLSGMGNDPNQKMMVWMMPIMFGFIAFTMPTSGIVLYWVVSTLFGLVQQAIYPGFPRLQGNTPGNTPGTKGAK